MIIVVDVNGGLVTEVLRHPDSDSDGEHVTVIVRDFDTESADDDETEVTANGDRFFESRWELEAAEHCVVCGHGYHEQGTECEDPDGCPCWAGGS